MPDATSPPIEQYWLLIGEVPIGPFTVAQIHAKLASGDVKWQTLACPVGGGNWLPLMQTPGIGPAASAAGDEPSQPQPASNSPVPQPAPEPRSHPAPGPRPDAATPSEPAADRTGNPMRSRWKRVWESLGSLLGILLLGGIIWRANCTGDKGGRDTAGDPPRAVPAEYSPYLRDGKVVPTGHPSLDYWVHINVYLETLKGSHNNLTLPSVLRPLAKGFRERPTAGVDPDLVRWVTAVAALLDARANIAERLNDPATLREASEEVAAGRPNPLDAMEQTVADWEGKRNQLLAEGKAIQETLSRRHGRTFPPPQL